MKIEDKKRDWWHAPIEPPVDGMEIVLMVMAQVDTILEIENRSFPVPWSREAFEYDLAGNTLAHYWTLLHEGKIIGYAGFWLIDHIAHLTTICIEESKRNLGVGKWFLLAVMEMGKEMGARRFTLEVRESNEVARKMYETVGYRVVGRRIKYYSEINEDALIMWTGNPPYET